RLWREARVGRRGAPAHGCRVWRLPFLYVLPGGTARRVGRGDDAVGIPPRPGAVAVAAASLHVASRTSGRHERHPGAHRAGGDSPGMVAPERRLRDLHARDALAAADLR